MQCKKRTFKHKKAALGAAAKFRSLVPDSDDMNAYKCQFCGCWHIGHERYNRPERRVSEYFNKLGIQNNTQATAY